MNRAIDQHIDHLIVTGHTSNSSRPMNYHVLKELLISTLVVPEDIRYCYCWQKFKLLDTINKIDLLTQYNTQLLYFLIG